MSRPEVEKTVFFLAHGRDEYIIKKNNMCNTPFWVHLYGQKLTGTQKPEISFMSNIVVPMSQKS